MIEAQIERYLVTQIKKRGGLCEKTRAIGSRGFFDRVVVMPGGRVWFVELKRPKGGVLSPHQKKRIADYRERGAIVAVCSNITEVKWLIDLIDSEPTKG